MSRTRLELSQPLSHLFIYAMDTGDKADSPAPTAKVKNEKKSALHRP
jgi:hypothetical protein